MDIIHKINDIAVEFFDDNNVKFAQRMGTSEANIRNYRSKTIPKVDFLVKLCNDLEINFEWLFNDSGDRHKTKIQSANVVTSEFVLRTDSRQSSQRIPLYDHIGAASLIRVFEGHHNIIDYITIPNLPKSDGAIYISGDSMYPLLKSGDIAIYKRLYDIPGGILFGETYILSVRIDDDLTTVVKYVQKSDRGSDWIKLVSQNSHHAALDFHLRDILAMGLVKASVRINGMI